MASQTERRFRTKYDFKAESSVELTLKQGDFVSSSAAPSDGWIKVKTSRRGTNGTNETVEGLVPYEFLEDITPPAPPRTASMRPAPPPPTQATQPKSVAEEHGECPICYYDWSSRPACVLLGQNGRRSCRHFLHKDCIEQMGRELRNRTCPICRAAYNSLREVPNFDADPKGWFSCVDFDQNGMLSRQEVLDILGVLLKIDFRALESSMGTLWGYWDKDNNGEIDYQEFCGKGGLLEYVKGHFAKAAGKPPPALTMGNREEFFTYWDEDGNGTLSSEEIVRATIKTLQVDVSKANSVREFLRGIWSMIDPDGSGEVDMTEFVQRDGLGEILVAYAQGLNG